VGAFIIALSILVFMINWYRSRRHGEMSGLDPWDARTIEWTIPNPTPEYNFATPPVVTRLDHFWHLKYGEDEEGRAVRKPDADQIVAALEYDGLNPKSPIHLPAPSYFPFVMALGLPIIFYGVIYHQATWGKAMILIGVLISLSALIGWAIEPLEEPADHHEDEHEDEAAELVEVDDE
jgi:cytochrome c oxidase subunit 1